MEHFRGFSTDIRQKSAHLPVRHGKALRQIPQGCSKLAVRSAVLTDDHFRRPCIRIFDIDRKLQSFFVSPHISSRLLPTALVRRSNSSRFPYSHHRHRSIRIGRYMPLKVPDAVPDRHKKASVPRSSPDECPDTASAHPSQS